MDTRRQLKVASLVKEAFAEILGKDGPKIYGKAFVTVTNAKVTSDLTLARFYLSVYNADNVDEVIEKITQHKFEIKRGLSEKLRHHIRRIPEIEFFKDETLDYVFHIEDLFKKIKDEDAQIKANLLEIKDEAPKKTTKPRKKK